MFPVKLNNYSKVKCCRQLYFDNEQDQMRCIDQLLQAQGFADQVDQYEFRAKPLQATPICSIKLAQHKVTGTKSAVKVINKQKLKESNGSQYYHEAAVMAKCRHPNIVRLVESFETEENVYISTAFQEGGDLINHINEHWEGRQL